jgi:adenylate kinase
MSRTLAAAPSVAVRAVHRDAHPNDDRRSAVTPTPTNVVLIGPPGAGKGTQAARLARALGVPTISTGDMLRRAVQSGSAIGIAVKAVMERGALIDDAMMTEIVATRLTEPDTHTGLVLDGFPRTVEQAIALDGLLERRGDVIAVELAVPESAILRRLTQRRVCERCGRNADPPAGNGAPHDGVRFAHATVCACGGALHQRSDDTETVIRERLRTYEQATRPLLDFYRQRRALRMVDGTQAPDLVTAQIARAIDAVFDHAAS